MLRIKKILSVLLIMCMTVNMPINVTAKESKNKIEKDDSVVFEEVYSDYVYDKWTNGREDISKLNSALKEE